MIRADLSRAPWLIPPLEPPDESPPPKENAVPAQPNPEVQLSPTRAVGEPLASPHVAQLGAEPSSTATASIHQPEIIPAQGEPKPSSIPERFTSASEIISAQVGPKLSSDQEQNREGCAHNQAQLLLQAGSDEPSTLLSHQIKPAQDKWKTSSLETLSELETPPVLASVAEETSSTPSSTELNFIHDNQVQTGSSCQPSQLNYQNKERPFQDANKLNSPTIQAQDAGDSRQLILSQPSSTDLANQLNSVETNRAQPSANQLIDSHDNTAHPGSSKLIPAQNGPAHPSSSRLIQAHPGSTSTPDQLKSGHNSAQLTNQPRSTRYPGPLPHAPNERAVLTWLFFKQRETGVGITAWIQTTTAAAELGIPKATYIIAVKRLVEAGRLTRREVRHGRYVGGVRYQIPEQVAVAIRNASWDLTQLTSSLNPAQPNRQSGSTSSSIELNTPLLNSSSSNTKTTTPEADQPTNSKTIERQLEQLLAQGYPVVYDHGVTAATLLAAVHKALRPHPHDPNFGITDLGDALEVIEHAAFHLELCERGGKGTPNSWPAYVGAALRDGYHAMPPGFSPWAIRREAARIERARGTREELEKMMAQAEEEERKLDEVTFKQWRRTKTVKELRAYVTETDPMFADFAPESQPFLDTLREYYANHEKDRG